MMSFTMSYLLIVTGYYHIKHLGQPTPILIVEPLIFFPQRRKRLWRLKIENTPFKITEFTTWR